MESTPDRATSSVQGLNIMDLPGAPHPSISIMGISPAFDVLWLRDTMVMRYSTPLR
ncbi:unnamed protein product [Discosporangium mesarthrocarpum]